MNDTARVVGEKARAFPLSQWGTRLSVSSKLWLEERDKPVWHLAVTRVASLDYLAACGWELSARDGRVWPQKPDDAGPPPKLRCHSCGGTLANGS